jgi:hypothetical protein
VGNLFGVATPKRSRDAPSGEIPEWTPARADELAGRALAGLGIADARISLKAGVAVTAPAVALAPEPLRVEGHAAGLFQFVPHGEPDRLRDGNALLDQWLQEPEKRCHELGWEGVFWSAPDPPAAES